MIANEKINVVRKVENLMIANEKKKYIQKNGNFIYFQLKGNASSSEL